jgi:hypothetical protein
MTTETHPLSRTPVINAGLAVCQEIDGGFLVMLPSGEIEFKASRVLAEKLCKRFFAAKCPADAVSFGSIRWHFRPLPAITRIEEVLITSES